MGFPPRDFISSPLRPCTFSSPFPYTLLQSPHTLRTPLYPPFPPLFSHIYTYIHRYILYICPHSPLPQLLSFSVYFFFYIHSTRSPKNATRPIMHLYASIYNNAYTWYYTTTNGLQALSYPHMNKTKTIQV